MRGSRSRCVCAHGHAHMCIVWPVILQLHRDYQEAHASGSCGEKGHFLRSLGTFWAHHFRSRGTLPFRGGHTQASSHLPGNKSEGPRRFRVLSMMHRPRCREARKADSSSDTTRTICIEKAAGLGPGWGQKPFQFSSPQPGAWVEYLLCVLPQLWVGISLWKGRGVRRGTAVSPPPLRLLSWELCQSPCEFGGGVCNTGRSRLRGSLSRSFCLLTGRQAVLWGDHARGTISGPAGSRDPRKTLEEAERPSPYQSLYHRGHQAAKKAGWCPQHLHREPHGSSQDAPENQPGGVQSPDMSCCHQWSAELGKGNV